MNNSSKCLEDGTHYLGDCSFNNILTMSYHCNDEHDSGMTVALKSSHIASGHKTQLINYRCSLTSYSYTLAVLQLLV